MSHPFGKQKMDIWYYADSPSKHHDSTHTVTYVLTTQENLIFVVLFLLMLGLLFYFLYKHWEIK